MIYSTKTRKMAVIGDPIDHSLSPFMHGALIEKHGFDALYIPVRVAPDETARFAEAAAYLGFCGFNATMPHKIRLLDIVDVLDGKASAYRAVNTVSIRDGVLTGSNTDVDGLMKALENREIPIKNTRVMIIGAGGVAGALIRGFTERGASAVTVLNRTLSAAQKAVEGIRGGSALEMTGENLCEAASSSDLIVNCTPLGMEGMQQDFQDLFFLDDTEAFIVDLIYNPWETKLLKYAGQRGLGTMNGLPMLICQGLLSFQLFTGITLDFNEEYEFLYKLCRERLCR